MGGSATGSLVVTNAAKVTSGVGASATGSSGVIASEYGSQGHARISGTGSQWRNDGMLVVGWEGKGELLAESSGLVQSLRGQVGRAVTSEASVAITTRAQWNVAQDLTIGGSEIEAGGAALLRVVDQGRVSVGTVLRVWGLSTIIIGDEGSLTVGQDVGPAISGAIHVGAGGILSGTGQIIGDVVIADGMLSPGASPGLLTIDGDLTLSPQGTLILEVGGDALGQFDQISILGDIELAGNLIVRFLDGWKPTSGEPFPMLTAHRVIGSGFASVQFENIDPLLVPASWKDGSFAVAVVPEPSSALLICLTAIAFQMGRCRKNRCDSLSLC